MVFLLLSGALAVVKWYSCLFVGHMQAKWHSCLYLGRLRRRNGIRACIGDTCGGEVVFLLVSGAPALVKLDSCLYLEHWRWRNDIPANVWGTCGGEVVFLLVSGAPAVDKWCSSLYLGHLRRRNGIPIVSGTPATAKRHSCLYLGHRQWRNSKQQQAKASQSKQHYEKGSTYLQKRIKTPDTSTIRETHWKTNKAKPSQPTNQKQGNTRA
jgi:hypothetical protein